MNNTPNAVDTDNLEPTKDVVVIFSNHPKIGEIRPVVVRRPCMRLADLVPQMPLIVRQAADIAAARFFSEGCYNDAADYHAAVDPVAREIDALVVSVRPSGHAPQSRFAIEGRYACDEPAYFRGSINAIDADWATFEARWLMARVAGAGANDLDTMADVMERQEITAVSPAPVSLDELKGAARQLVAEAADADATGGPGYQETSRLLKLLGCEIDEPAPSPRY